jgi:hypothetical protein
MNNDKISREATMMDFHYLRGKVGLLTRKTCLGHITREECLLEIQSAVRNLLEGKDINED